LSVALLVPTARIERATSPLPRECSTTELRGRFLPLVTGPRLADLFDQSTNPCIRCAGAGEGNRTLVVSLEGFCSTIELHPHIKQRSPLRLRWLAPDSFSSPARSLDRVSLLIRLVSRCARRCRRLRPEWWRGKDSNLRRQSRQIYSLLPLATWVPLRRKPHILAISVPDCQTTRFYAVGRAAIRFFEQS
jgi:hypothetical protein